jgi:hypothetical protein
MDDAARLTLALLPVVAIAAAAIALRPRNPDTVAPIRSAIVRAAVVIGGIAVAGAELLSTMDRVDLPGMVVFWVAVTALAVAGAGLRWPKSFPGLDFWRTAPWLAMLGLGGLVLGEVVLAVCSAPNNYDSNYYHLSKVEHWVVGRNVGLYPTTQLQQVAFAPGGEYLLLHLRVLTGGDHVYNLVQFAAGLGAAIAVSRVAAQLGAGRRGQLLAAAILLTTPMVVLQSTSTQTDLIVAAWVGCAATLALDGQRRRSLPLDVVALGVTGGLCAATKSTGLMGLAAILVLWGITQLRLGVRFLPGTAGAALAIVAVALVVYGPFMLRMQSVFGSPLGPPSYTEGLAMQRHDPAAVLANGLRIASSTVVVPVPAVNTAVADAVMAVARDIGVDPQDPAITLASGKYPDPRWGPDEDHAPFPVQSVLIIGAVVASLAARRVPGAVRIYGGVALLTLASTAATVKWQLWGNRLLLPEIVVAVPLVGWWLERVLQHWRRLLSAFVVVTVAVSFAGGYASVLLGQPRRLVGHGSVFTQTELQQRFARQPAKLAAYERVADVLKASGARRIGLKLNGDQWEYPLWVMLPGRRFESVQSWVPGVRAPQLSEMDGVVCIAPDCRTLVPATWHYVQVDNLIAVATRP